MDYKTIGQPTKIHNLTSYNCDCMDLLKETPDKYYELAIVDPPYGIDVGYRDWETDRKSTRLNSSHSGETRMPSSA